MDSGEQEYDNLEDIYDIGETWHGYLREVQIYRFEDLATISADTLHKRLKETVGKSPSEDKLNEWIEEARKLSPQLQNDSNAMLDNEDDLTPLPNKAQKWQPLASFIVEYQEQIIEGRRQIRTFVEKSEAENEDVREVWPGVAREQLHDWMLEQAGIQPLVDEVEEVENEKQPPEEDIVTVEKEGAVMPKEVPLELEIMQLLVYQPPQSESPTAIGEPEHPFRGMVQAKRQCIFAVLYELPDQNDDLSGTSDIIAQFYAYNATTGNWVEVPTKPENKSIPIDKTKHKIEFPQTSLPAGFYRLEIILRENKPLSNINYAKFPGLNVY